MGQQQGQQGGCAVRPRERGELGNGVEGGGVGDQLGGEAVREQGEQQLVGGGASERLLQQTVGQVVHVARHAPAQHSLDLGGELAGRPPLPPSLNIKHSLKSFFKLMLCVTFIVMVLSWEVLPPILSVVIFFVVICELYRQMFSLSPVWRRISV